MIFNLFKSKPTLKELIPEGFVDIHSHILPGIDDGAKNIEESLKLISVMKKMKFYKIIATPHTYPGVHSNTIDTIKNSFNYVMKKNKNQNIKIDFATEYMIDNYLGLKADCKELMCLKDNYVLVEMSYIAPSDNLLEIIYKICVNGYIPILAHPERYRYYFSDYDMFYKLKKRGCKFQLNLFSTIGYYGKDITKITNKLLKDNLIDFVGSDIHNSRHLRNFEKEIRIGEKEIIKLSEAIESNIKKFS